jgi:gliding motility-associated-like protein
MRIRVIKTLAIFFLSAFFFVRTNAQGGLCPPNLDFELGDFSNWVCQTGRVQVSNGVNKIIWTGTGQANNRHTIIPAATAGTDQYGRFPRNCPNGSGYSVQLGNNQGGAQAESISYTYTIPATSTVFSILFNYAVVFQDPLHQPEEQPRFRARITDLTSSSPIPCVTFDFTASASLPGFIRSPVDPTVFFKDWTPVTINLSTFAGRTIQLEFITSDCVFSQHFGYAYIDVNSTCNGAIQGNTVCLGDTSTTLTAPFGFQNYTWFSDPAFTTVLSATQTLTLTPPPTVGSVFPIIVEPFAGFGCRDTLYASIAVAPKPLSDAGTDKSICRTDQVQIGNATVSPILSYSWMPAAQVNDPRIPNPMAWIVSNTPTDFVIKTTDILTGCFSYDTVIVSKKPIDTSIRLTGPADFCNNRMDATLTVGNSLTSIQWYDANTLLAGITSPSYQPAITGSYWAQVKQSGCTDTTAIININVHPLPAAAFTPVKDSACINNPSFVLNNGSTTPDNAAMSHLWKYSNGNTQSVTDGNPVFTTAGTYNAELITTTIWGCKDSVNKSLYVMPNGIANFIWDSICIGRPMKFTNLSVENNSPLVKYAWDFKNGDPVYTQKNPPLITYNTPPGFLAVELSLTALGCENFAQKITQQVLVNNIHKPVTYKTITVPQYASQFIQVRDTIGKIYNWKPQIHLNSYNTRSAAFYANGNDVKYLVDITDPHTCVTTDTLLVQVLKKPGYYLPTAFTPNGDGLNDVAVPYLVGMKGLKSFSIFNRWGNRVFYTTRYEQGWDGRINGVVQDVAVYVWVLEFYDSNNQLVMEKGTIAIIK